MTSLAEVIPFKGLRYNPLVAGDFADLVSPPYDIISPAEQLRFHQKSTHNAIHLDFGLTEPGDGENSNRYTRAAACLGEWIREGILTPEPVPAFYLLREDFTGPDGKPASRTGFFAAVRLREFSEGIVLPHEETASGPKQDRLSLMEATAANLSPIFCLYSDPAQEIVATLSKAGVAAADGPAVDITDDAGIRHRLWAITDAEAATFVTRALADATLLIADGHHRYETALNYRNARRQQAGISDQDSPQPYDYLMVYLTNMDDAAPQVLPIHRVVSGLAAETLATLPVALEKDFEVTKITPATTDTQPASRKLIELIADAAGSHNSFGLFLPQRDEYYLLVSRRQRPVLDEDNGHSEAWRSLEVSVLDRLVLSDILGIRKDAPNETARVTFVERTETAIAQAKDCDAVFFVSPTSMAEIKAVAEAGEKMPQKSTYFHPKPLTGLVFRSFDY